ncbi:MAG: D-aminoacyl-tRNA deacylase [Candidatus Lokiarchaeota archaeon]|nr:D-aminoacyl-tRNA deacylase [Candidatus Lokiarchaeota archaeon]
MPDFLIISGTKDTASMNIRERLLTSSQFQFHKIDSKWHNNIIYELSRFDEQEERNSRIEGNRIYLGLTNTSLIHLNDLKLAETEINFDYVIIASRHRSQTSRPALLVHTTGNWGKEAEYGGNPRELSYASALLRKSGFLSLLFNSEKVKLEEFAIDVEVTHHGPSVLKKPLIFIELGSSEEEWTNVNAAKVVANSIIETIVRFLQYNENEDQKIGLGFGGTHYAPNFSRLEQENNIAFSFICPKYFIKDLDKTMIDQMIGNTVEKIDFFVIDWKGTNSEEKQHLIEILSEFNIPIRKTKDFK